MSAKIVAPRSPRIERAKLRWPLRELAANRAYPVSTYASIGLKIEDFAGAAIMVIDEQCQFIIPQPPDRAPPPHEASSMNHAAQAVIEVVCDVVADEATNVVADGIFDAICNIVVGVFED